MVARGRSVTTPIRTVERDGVVIAYQVTGRGMLDLLVVHDFAGHLELDWELPGAARLFERLGAFARVIRFDKRGTGLSSRDTVVAGPETDAGDALAVLDAVGASTAAVFAWGDGVASALVLAARHPERIASLAVFGGWARPPLSLGEAMAAAERAQESWGETLPPGFAPGADEALRRWWTVRARASASPATASALVLTQAQADLRSEAERVAAPTLVLHRAGDTAVPPAAGRALAELIPAARYSELSGAAHLPYLQPDEVADELEVFFTGGRPERDPGLAGYDVQEELGRGGMGTVYLARDARLGRNVALKLLPAELAGDAGYRERFLREQRIAASIEHPNIVPIYDAGDADGRLYLVMRYVEGTDLKRLVEDGPLDPVRAVRIVEQVAEALDAAHASGLVHRDVKPANVLLDAASHAYLCDFGLTKEAASGPGVTASGQLVGTLDYLAPEQIRGDEVDRRADVYALGCVLYELLTGRPPFGGRSEAQTLWGHMQEEAPPPSSLRPGLPTELDAVVLRSLAKEPDARYATAGGLAGAARSALGLEAPAVVRRRRRWASAALLAGVVALLIAAVAVAYQLLRGSSPVGAGPASVAVIDPASSRLVGDIRVGEEPTGAAWDSGTLWVTSAVDGTLTRVDGRRREAVRTIGVGTDADAVAVAGDEVWVAGKADATLVGVDRTTNLVQKHLPLAGPGDPGLQAYELAAGFGSLWAAGGPMLVRVDPVRSTVVGETPFDDVTRVAVDGKSVWATDFTGLHKLEPAPARKVGWTGFELPIFALAARSGTVWVAGVAAGRQVVWKIDAQTLARVGTVRVSDAIGGTDAIVTSLAAGPKALWIGADDGSVVHADPVTCGVVALLHLSGRPSAIALGGGHVWVTLQELSDA